MIPSPFLLYLGHCNDPIGVKTSRGLAVFRPEACVGEFAHDDCALTLGLDRLTMAQAAARGARTLVLGIANAGGVLEEALVEDALSAIAHGLNVASGLHQRLQGEPRLVAAARAAGVRLFDVRDPPANPRVGTGRPRAGNRLLTVGTDCSVGKMFATLAITRELHARGQAADFRATGQTGILIAGSGVAVDAVVADFISGAVEAITPARTHGWDVIEGQGSLLHPSFAGVSLGLLHGSQPGAIVLCHEPGRAHMRGLSGQRVPELAETLALNLQLARLTSPGVRAVGVCLNTSALDEGAARALCDDTAAELGLPCTDPVRFGVASIVDML